MQHNMQTNPKMSMQLRTHTNKKK